jgi:arsenate reductase (thioredoxin)
MNAAVARRLAAEFTGTGLLVAVVVGSGIAATRLTSDGALRLLVNSVVTGLGLAVLIVVFNAGRSQMAAALLDHRAAGRIRVTSAGSQPADQLNPAVVEAMAEIGLDISREFPQPLTADQVQAADVVVTMGCGDACPIYPGQRYEDWDLPDPAGLSIEQVRPIRDEIARRVAALTEELAGAREDA